MITASMAFLPERVNALNTNSIRRQVDILHQYRGDDELGDANKFRGVIEKKGYLFTVDDDLIYPEGYVDYMISKIEEYERKAVITLHGKILNRQPITDFYAHQWMSYRCLGTVREDTPVHIAGTGVLAWHSDTIQFKLSDFPEKNMADIWASIVCEVNDIPRICVAHETGWLKHIESIGGGCWEWNKDRKNVLTNAINSIFWKKI